MATVLVMLTGYARDIVEDLTARGVKLNIGGSVHDPNDSSTYVRCAAGADRSASAIQMTRPPTARRAGALHSRSASG